MEEAEGNIMPVEPAHQPETEVYSRPATSDLHGRLAHPIILVHKMEYQKQIDGISRSPLPALK
jgi:hypothetical protein